MLKPFLTATLLGSCVHHPPANIQPVPFQLREPDRVITCWRIDPSDDMVASLIGASGLAACREAQTQGFHTCATRIADCMQLLLFQDHNEIHMCECTHPGDHLVLSPVRPDGRVQTIPLTPLVPDLLGPSGPEDAGSQ